MGLFKKAELTTPPPEVIQELDEKLGEGNPEMPAFFLFSQPKSGSTMLNHAFDVICRKGNIPDTNLPGIFFRNGTQIGTWTTYDLRPYIKDGYCHRGYRYLPTFYTQLPLIQERKSIILLRDVRDAATSHYFSIKHEHPVPGGGKGDRAEGFLKRRESLHSKSIDDHVSTFAKNYVKQWKKYVKNLPIESGLAKIYRYEDIIFNKREFFLEILEHAGVSVPDEAIDAAIKKVDVFPDEERINRRARQVTPGDHRKKLQPETIERLNHECKEYLAAMNYD